VALCTFKFPFQSDSLYMYLTAGSTVKKAVIVESLTAKQ